MTKVTPEEKREHRREYHREYERKHGRKRRANMTEEQREARRKAERKRYRKRRANMTEEQREAEREAQRKRRANMTEEQREAEREAAWRSDVRGWAIREKAKTLGVYKKIWPHLTLKELEKRYALHLLWRSQMCTTCTPGEPERSCIACLLHSTNNKR